MSRYLIKFTNPTGTNRGIVSRSSLTLAVQLVKILEDMGYSAQIIDRLGE